MDKFIMNKKERKQLIVFEKLLEGEILQVQAAKMLGWSTRWVRKKFKRFLKEGAIGVIHKNRGEVSPKRLNEDDVALFISLIQKEEWKDFGPTFAAKKFRQIYKKKMSAEKARQIMIAEGIWIRRKRKVQHRKRRPRKEVLGLMVQLDGSPHDWFEGRGPKCTLIVFIDDATSQILWLEFVKSESFVGVAGASKHYFEKHGLPGSLYVDYGSVFSVNMHNPDRTKLTQFERAMKELDIKITHARSPQAKGRVERSNRTLQDHLVKEMRLEGISSIEEANKFVHEGKYLREHNEEYSVAPEKPGNAHLPIKDYDLETIICCKNKRIVANDFTVSYKGLVLQLEKHQATIVRPKNSVVIHESLDASLSIYIRKIKLNFTIVGACHGRKPSPVDYVNQARKEENGLFNESRMKPAGGLEISQAQTLSNASKSGTNYFGEKRN